MLRKDHAVSARNSLLCRLGLCTIAAGTIAISMDASSAYSDDRVDTVMMLSLRESEQVRRTAQAVVYGSAQDRLKDELVGICETTKKSMDQLSIPLMKDAEAFGGQDAAVADVLRKLASLQQLAYKEIVAAQAVLESDDKRSAIVAFGDIDRKTDELYRETASAMHRLSKRGAGGDATGRASAGEPAKASASPNPAVFSDEQWAAIVVELQRRGMVRDPSDAKDFVRILALLKGVFVDKGIRDPSPRALFRLAKILLHQDGSGIRTEKIESTFRQMLLMADEMHMEVASKEQLLELNRQDE